MPCIRCRRASDIHTKSDRSPVTVADLLSHDLLRAFCRLRYPEIPILSEEDSERNLRHLVDGRPCLVLDPVDGTKEFITGRDEFTINIGLVEAGVATAGLIYAPALKRLFFGSRSAGAYTRTLPGRTRRMEAASHRQQSKVVVISRSHNDDCTRRIVDSLAPWHTRPLGSSLKFALVATGEADAYVRSGPIMVWDCAAGQALVEAAGGIVVRIDGGELRYDRNHQGRIEGLIAAQTPEMAARVLAACRSADPTAAPGSTIGREVTAPGQPFP